MSLGIAAVIIFVLYLIDKNRRWRQASKITLAFLVLALIAIGGVIVYDQYDSWQHTRIESRSNAINCGLDTNGHIVLNNVGTCLPPLPNGSRIDASPPVPVGFGDTPPLPAGATDCPPCWTAPDPETGLQLDQDSLKIVDGKLLPPEPNRTCYPLKSRK